VTDDDDPVVAAVEISTHAQYRAAQAAKWAKLVAESPTHLICGHCDAPMEREEQGLRCSARCRKAGRKNLRQWRTREGRVMNVRCMEERHLQAAIRYLETQSRTTGNGYQWLREERERRGLGPAVKFEPPKLRDVTIECGACGNRVSNPPEIVFRCSCGQMVWNTVEPEKPEEPPPPKELADEWDLDPPPKRGINLKGVPK
jgi:hypothetical protein